MKPTIPKVTTPAIAKPKGIVIREPKQNPPRARVKRSNTWVRTEAVKPSKFDRYKDAEVSSSSTPMDTDSKKNDPKEPPKDDKKDDNAMAE